MSEISIDSEGLKYVQFSVDGKPFGKERPKFARQGNFVKTYTPQNTLLHEEEVAIMYAKVAKGQRFAKGIVDARVQKFYSDEPRVEVSIHVAE